MNELLLVGVDEVGRGPLAGPVLSVAVGLRVDLRKCNDSLSGFLRQFWTMLEEKKLSLSEVGKSTCKVSYNNLLFDFKPDIATRINLNCTELLELIDVVNQISLEVLPTEILEISSQNKSLDSKKLSDVERKVVYDKIVSNNNFLIKVGVVDNNMIGEINIRKASCLAMKKAVFSVIEEAFRCSWSSQVANGILTFVDGVDEPIAERRLKSGDGMWHNIASDAGMLVVPVKKGDARLLLVGLASIVAKYLRDEIMSFFSKHFEHDFASHKGYPTPQHYLEIERCGVTPIHRLNFKLFKDVG